MRFSDNLAKILDKYENLGNKLSSGIMGDEFVKASKEYAELEDVVAKLKNIIRLNLSLKKQIILS